MPWNENPCVMPGPDDLLCWKERHHEGAHAAGFMVGGVDVNVTWDYIQPARYVLPAPVAEGLESMRACLSELGWEWFLATDVAP